MPILDRYGIEATFYVLPSMLGHHPRSWREAVAAGHELGNHTVSHPCSCNFPFSRENTLEDYTLERLEGELVQANEALATFAGRRASPTRAGSVSSDEARPPGATCRS
jgi:peptidoglycan-N-acetylglucosamine deacetylase